MAAHTGVAQDGVVQDGVVQDVTAWTLHVGQYHDEQRAQAQVDQLQQVGFDAYLEPSVLARLLKVRVGCFLHPAAADTVAALLAAYIATELVLTPLSARADVRLCIDQQVGFIIPDAWGIQYVNEHGVVFWIQLAAQTGYVVYHEGWYVSQDEPHSLTQRTPVAPDRVDVTRVDVTRQAAFTTSLLPAELTADASQSALSTLSAVRYQLEDASQLAAVADDVSTNATINTANVATLNATTVGDTNSVLKMNNTDGSDLQTSTADEGDDADDVSDAERRLVASLARLPRRPQVSLQPTSQQATSETILNDAPNATNATNRTADVPRAHPTPPDRLSMIVSSGNILWHNQDEVVLQQQDKLVSLRIVPVSLLSDVYSGEDARE